MPVSSIPPALLPAPSAEALGLGGVMIWEVGQDATGKQALLPVLVEAGASQTP